ncbi:MAG: hypothetical protein J0H12_07500 [Candidatus Paracaedimonas acanthamoebae]|uniref:Uncharacterized protein n=1 Tax=Candidatus Paracaedimonas acanthamoebae TaxID=244581 RepID=A0A8J7PZX7_9PROT|nr:hypothetical protein [Candidatus Paracaedimonas acanthamoebae]
MQTRLLINEAPLQIFPTLARKIGLNEAIVLQQMHYWLHRNRDKSRNSHRVYNTSEQWQKQFPFWSIDTLRRTIVSLKSQGLIIDTKVNQKKPNQCFGYTINYEALENIKACNNRTGQNDTIEETLRTSDRSKMTRSIVTICPEQIDTIEDNRCSASHGYKEYFYES